MRPGRSFLVFSADQSGGGARIDLAWRCWLAFEQLVVQGFRSGRVFDYMPPAALAPDPQDDIVNRHANWRPRLVQRDIGHLDGWVRQDHAGDGLGQGFKQVVRFAADDASNVLADLGVVNAVLNRIGLGRGRSVQM